MVSDPEAVADAAGIQDRVALGPAASRSRIISGSGRRSRHLTGRTDPGPFGISIFWPNGPWWPARVMFSSPRETYGRWAESFLGADSLATPHLMPVQAATISRTTAPAGSGQHGAQLGTIGVLATLHMRDRLASRLASRLRRTPATRSRQYRLPHKPLP